MFSHLLEELTEPRKAVIRTVSLSQQGKKKISKEKRPTGRSPGEISRGFPVVSASEVTRMALLSPSNHVTTRTGKVT